MRLPPSMSLSPPTPAEVPLQFVLENGMAPQSPAPGLGARAPRQESSGGGLQAIDLCKMGPSPLFPLIQTPKRPPQSFLPRQRRRMQTVLAPIILIPRKTKVRHRARRSNPLPRRPVLLDLQWPWLLPYQTSRH